MGIALALHVKFREKAGVCERGFFPDCQLAQSRPFLQLSEDVHVFRFRFSVEVSANARSMS
jgi:hypothetical protein